VTYLYCYRGEVKFGCQLGNARRISGVTEDDLGKRSEPHIRLLSERVSGRRVRLGGINYSPSYFSIIPCFLKGFYDVFYFVFIGVRWYFF